MLNAKLSDLLSATSLAGGELIYIVQGGNSRQAALGKTGAQLMQDTGQTDAQSTLGITSYMQGLLADTGLTNALDTLGGATNIRDYLDPLKSFNADGSTDDAANFATLEASVTGQKIDGRGRRFGITGDIPAANEYTNGFWVIANYEGDLSVDIPFDFATLPYFKTTLLSSPGHSSWPEDSGWYWEGRKGVSYTSSNHQTGDRFQAFSQRGAIDHWRKPAADFSRDVDDAPNGFWNQGGCVIRGVEFRLVRRQSAGGSFPTDHRIYARNLDRWLEFTDIITPRDGLTTFRIFKSDVSGVEVLENTVITIIAADTVGGQTISGTFTCNANNSSFMEFTAAPGAFVGTTKGGGFTILKIPETNWTERTFSAGASLGEQLVVNTGDDGLLTSQPAVCLGLAPIASDLTGSCYLTAGGGYGLYVAKVTGLCAGNNECALSFVKKQASWASYSEPTITVSDDDENVVYVGLRSDSASVAPAIAITQNAFSTSPSPSLITTTGGWALDNPLPTCIIEDDAGEEWVFMGATGNRGGNSPSQGWSRLPIYLLYASKTSLLASGGTAMKAIKVGWVNWFDMWTDVGASGRSGVGVGTIIALPGKVEYILGDMQPNGNWDKPLVNIVSVTVDVTRIVGGERPAVSQSVELSSAGYLEWTGLSGDITTGNIFVPERCGTETYGDALGTDGIFVVPVTGRWRCTVSIMINGSGSEQSAVLWDEDTGAAPAYPAFSGDLSTTWALFRANLPTGTNMSVHGSVTIYARAGQRLSVRTGANTTAKASTIQNLLRWEMVG